MSPSTSSSTERVDRVEAAARQAVVADRRWLLVLDCRI